MKSDKNKTFYLLIAGLLTTLIGITCKEKPILLRMATHRTLGLAYLEEKKFNKAESEYSKLIKIAPNEMLGYANLGLVYFRTGKLDAAEKYMKKALEVDPYNPQVGLNLAEVLFLTDREQEAIHLLEGTLTHYPDHVRTLYKLALLYTKSSDREFHLQAEELLQKVVGFIPGNIPARLLLIETLALNGKTDQAIGHLEALNQQLPEFPERASGFYDQSFSFLTDKKPEQAYRPLRIIHNILKPTPFYRAGFSELKGISGNIIGTPVFNFSQPVIFDRPEQPAVLETIQFTDAAGGVGLDIKEKLKPYSLSDFAEPFCTLADFDGDGDQDLYISGWLTGSDSSVHFLYRNDNDKFVDITSEAGLKHIGRDLDADFIDYDNDGDLDIFIVNSAANVLYVNFKPGKFRNMAEEFGIAGDGSGVKATIADFDHDGDLDIYTVSRAENRFYRNNLDGTFTERADSMGLAGGNSLSSDAVYGDFDDDDDLDLFIVNQGSNHTLYTNLRQGYFKDITPGSGLENDAGGGIATVGDYNNDGKLDLFLTKGGTQSFQLFSNQGKNIFEEDHGQQSMVADLQNIVCLDVHFFDFDNDGFLDLIVVGDSKDNKPQEQRIFLFHNDGSGVFTNVSFLLPQDISAAKSVEVADYDEDGDLDIFVCTANDNFRLLRNDGGNINRFLKVKLVGLRSGSGKNNYYGLGAKMEIRVDDLYQSRVVTEPVSFFGLGQHKRVDAVRIFWSNGVPQNIIKPRSNRSLVEKQILKGSCPFLYAWDGEKYEFVTDVLWRSALGMPLGIMGGELAYAFCDPAQDYFKIPGDKLKEKDGVYSIQLTAELWETAYFDQVKLLVVDHPDTIDIFVDECFTPPPYPPFKIYQVSEQRFPKSIVDDRGNNLAKTTQFQDDLYVSNLQPGQYQGITKDHDLILDLGNLSGEDSILLFMNGWIFPTDASINVAVSQSSTIEVNPPSLQVKNESGEWQTVIENISFPMGKNKTVIIDLSFLTDNYQVRISTNMQIYWNHIFFTTKKSKIPLQLTSLLPQDADLHYRGFSRLYRKGNRYGPHWFDYSDVTTDPIWQDLVGKYTRFGDVLELLAEPDSKYVIMNAGDEITINFDAEDCPELQKGWSRDFIIYTDGWLKDGDLNTAAGQTVEPLPFRGMTHYPYGPEQNYPDDAEHQQFLKKYVTRKVTSEKFRNMISSK